MEFVRNWLGYGRPRGPEIFPTDQIIPLNDFDDNLTNKFIALDFTMCFGEALDPEKLHEALWKLLERPGWRKLGARLRMNSDGRLEYHVPAEYTQERPPVNYTHGKNASSFMAHPVFPKLPIPNGTVQVFDSGHLSRIAVPEEHTTKLSDWTQTDRAQLSLHIVSFQDATLVTLTWLHTLLDAMGRHTLLKAWAAVLNGKEDEIPEFYGYDFDPLKQLGSGQTVAGSNEKKPAAQNEQVEIDQQLTGLSAWRFVFNYFWEIFFYPETVVRVVVVPAPYFASIKKQALLDLETAPESLVTMSRTDPSNPKPFLSDGDILCAWFMRLLATTNSSFMSSPAARTVHLQNQLGMREILSKTSPVLLPGGTAYIGNCVTAVISLFSQHDFISQPLGHIAAQIRKDLIGQSTRPFIESSMHLMHENGGKPVLRGTGDMAMFSFSNWTKAKLYDTDFAAAIAEENHLWDEIKDYKKHIRGRPIFLDVNATTAAGFTLRNTASCAGQDHDGNFWFGTSIRKQFADDFEQAIKGMN